MSAINNDAPTNTIDPLDLDGTEGEFLKLWNDEDAAKPSDDSKDEEDTKKKPKVEPEASEDDESPSEEDSEDEGSDEESDEEETKAPTVAGDEAIVKVKVDGKELDVPVKELKRLYGQEQSLTRKSEEVANARKQVEEAGKAHMVGINKLLENAKARFEPYSKIDFLVASKELSGPELQALRTEAEKAYADIRFLETELDGTLKAQEAEYRQTLQKQAAECVKVLTDPKDGIEGWNESMYQDLRAYAVSNGIPQTEINQLVDPVAFKVLHKAMLYDKGKAVVTKKVEKSPKKIIKTSTSDKKVLTGNKSDSKSAMDKARRTNEIEDFADVFLNRWAEDDK